MNFFDALGGSSMPGAAMDTADRVRGMGLAAPNGVPDLAPPPTDAGMPPMPPVGAPQVGTDPTGGVPTAPPPIDPTGGAGAGQGGGLPSYKAITQSDGTVVLHVVSPNGALGPAVKIIPAPKQTTGGGQ